MTPYERAVARAEASGWRVWQGGQLGPQCRQACAAFWAQGSKYILLCKNYPEVERLEALEALLVMPQD